MNRTNKTLTIRRETYEELAKAGTLKDTFDSTISRLLKMQTQAQTSKQSAEVATPQQDQTDSATSRHNNSATEKLNQYGNRPRTL